jgi:hypothetical protein
MKNIFKNKLINHKVFIDWLTDYISLPQGKLLRWDGVFYRSFESETLIRVHQGIVKKSILIQNYTDSPDKLNRRYGDKVSDIFFNKIKVLDWAKLNECSCDENYIITIGKNGKITKIQMSAFKPKDYKYCIKTLFNSLRSFRFDFIKKKGKRISENIYLDLFYNTEEKKLEKSN